MDITTQFTREQLMYIGLIGCGIGLLLGLIPLFLGIRKSRSKLGILALVLSTVLGGFGLVFYGGILLSIAVVLVFSWLVTRKRPA
jgi:hypothetical protein